MPSSVSFLGILLSLIAALSWGSGDYAGGRASLRSSVYQVLALSAFSGLVLLIVASLIWRESFPSTRGIVYAVLGGAASAGGIAALYKGLSIGPAALVAPTSAVIAAALPVLYGMIFSGMPPVLRLVGFGLALVGIWLVSSSAPQHQEGSTRKSFLLACLAGSGFGLFFIALGLMDSGKIFTPLIIFRCMTLTVGLLLVRANRQPLPPLTSNPAALLAGALDVGGNLFYILAKQYTPFEVVAVISSLYPAATVLLAAVLLREKVLRFQWVGVGVCLAAIAMISAS